MKRVCNLDDASSIAILFSAFDQNGFPEIKRFLKTLSFEGHKLYVIAYIDDKEVPDYLSAEKSINLITQNDLNWLYKPQNEFIKAFVNTNFDILINLDVQNSLPIQYLCTSSIAGFKVGPYFADDQMLDFMINTNGNSSIKYLIDNLEYYLRILNRKK
jgi:hypothetical protein